MANEKKKRKLFSFATRDEVLQEILHGGDAPDLIGFACPKCQRLHVTCYAVRLTAFSNLDIIDLPADVQMTADRGDLKSPVLTKACPADGTPMTAMRNAENEWLFRRA